ncbi:MAG: hypothetical protein HUU01_21305 [Saprospiraceae bacterium]|nr:hypothetical protein [Saprospiraceae bacterium]
MLTTLNIVIGLIFVLLLFSLLASTVMEVIAAILSLRAKNLRYTLDNMLGEKVDDFLRHPLFRQLSYATNRRARLSPYSLPGYLSKSTFVAIFQDIMEAGGGREGLVKKIEGLDEGDLKRMMQFMLRQSGGDPALFMANSERWFDEVMERASEWYKRNLKWWLFAVGLALAAIFNADTIRMYKNISSSATVQAFLVEMATDFSEKTDTIAPTNMHLTLEQSIARMDSSLQKIDQIQSPLGLGWDAAETDRSLPWWLVKIAGLLLTAIAVTFGAPFWFDLLKKLLNLRSGAKEKAPDPQTPVAVVKQETPPLLPEGRRPVG